MTRSERMAPVQQVLEGTEQTRARELGDGQKRLAEAEAKLTELRTYHGEYLQTYRKRAEDGTSVTKLRDFQAFLARLEQATQPAAEGRGDGARGRWPRNAATGRARRARSRRWKRWWIAGAATRSRPANAATRKKRMNEPTQPRCAADRSRRRDDGFGDGNADGRNLGKAAPAASGDAPAAEEAHGVSRALESAAPADTPASGAPPPVSAQTDDKPAEDAVVIDMAAVMAAMLQAAVPAQQSTSVPDTATEGAAPLGDASVSSDAAARLVALANLRAAATAGTTAADADASVENPGRGPILRRDSEFLGRQDHQVRSTDRVAPAVADACAASQRCGWCCGYQCCRTGSAGTGYLCDTRRVASPRGGPGGRADERCPQPQELPASPAQVESTPDSTLSPANLAAPAQQTRTASAVPEQTLQAPVGTPRWADELGSRLVLMSLRGQHEGSLNLTPEHLGPLEVRVGVNQGTASVWFGSQHADTRAALTEALPRLRELMASAGLNLGQTGVSQQAPRQWFPRE